MDVVLRKALKNGDLHSLLWGETNQEKDNNKPINKSIKSKSNTENSDKNAEVDDFNVNTMVWHNKLLNRSGHIIEHELKPTNNNINHNSIKDMISSILFPSRSSDSLNYDISNPASSISNSKKFFSTEIATMIEDLSSFERRKNKQRKMSNAMRLIKGSLNSSNNTNNRQSIKKEIKTNEANNNEDLTTIANNNFKAESFILNFRKVSKKKKKVTSVDVVADLFHMSNEMRQEREMIVTRQKGDIDTFIKRDITLKYNDELDEVNKNKSDNKLNSKKAYLLRLKRASAKFKIIDKSGIEDFSTFWSTFLHMNSITITKGKRRTLKQIPEPEVKEIKPIIQVEKPIEKPIQIRRSNIESKLEQNVVLLLKTKVLIANRIQSRQQRNQLKNSFTNPSSGAVNNENMNDPKRMSHVSITTAMLDDNKFRHTYGLETSYKLDESYIEHIEDIENIVKSTTTSLSSIRTPWRTPIHSSNISRNNSYIDKSYNQSKENTAVKLSTLKLKQLNRKLAYYRTLDFSKPLGINLFNDINKSPKSTRILKATTNQSAHILALSFDNTLGPLEGRWLYDPLVSYNPQSKETSVGKFVRSRGSHKQFVSYPIKIKGNEYEEFIFDAESLTIHITYIRDSTVYEHLHLHVSSVSISPSIYPNMITLRSSLVPSTGYICCIPTYQWEYIEHEIENTIEKLVIEENKKLNQPFARPTNRSAFRKKAILQETKHGDTFLTNVDIAEDYHNVGGSSETIELTELTLNNNNTSNDFMTDEINTIDKSIVNYSTIRSGKYDTSYQDIQKLVNSITNISNKSVLPELSYLSNQSHFLQNLINEAKAVDRQTWEHILYPTNKSPSSLLPHPPSTPPKRQGRVYSVSSHKSTIETSGYVSLGQPVSLVLKGQPPPIVEANRYIEIRSPVSKIYRPIKESIPKPLKNRKILVHIPDQPRLESIDESAVTIPEVQESILSNEMKSDSETVKEIEKEIEIDEFDKAVMLIETNRIMQLYFAKKFLQLDRVLDVQMTLYDATEALTEDPDIYGVIFISLLDLLAEDNMKETLDNLIPKHLDRHNYTVIVYGSIGDDDDILSALEESSVDDFIEEPYTLAVIKDTLATHITKHQLRKELYLQNAENTFTNDSL